MLFNSPEFLLGLLPLSLLGFFCPGRTRISSRRDFWLTIASLFFYGWWNVSYVPLLICSILFNFFVGEKLRGQARAGSWLILALPATCSCWATTSISGFLTEVVSDAAGLNWAIPHVVLPLAISFFTFQQIAYLVDCHAGLVKETNLLNYAAFITFFPHLIAGPITHHKEIIPQFQSWADLQTPAAIACTRRYDISRRALQKSRDRRRSCAICEPSVRRGGKQSAADRNRLLDRRVCIHSAALLRFFWLLRYGGRRRVAVRHPLATEFLLAAEISKHRGVLAALAYDADPIYYVIYL